MPITATSPGRVNLIGEHTDYNGGWVLPAALSVSLTATIMPREDRRISVSARGYSGTAERTLDDAAEGDWSDPAVGSIIEAVKLGLLTGGADIAVQSSIPAGSGLSSSAALIVTLLKAAREAAGSGLTDTEIAVAARRVENDYIGVPCGIMDQMAVAIAKPGEAMALDTSSLEYRVVALPKTHDMVVIHSGKTRKLTDGRYAARKEECDAAKAAFGTNDLCLLDPDNIESFGGIDDTIRRRARHCATEHRRVLASIEALESGDVCQFGALMAASHASMRDDFEMSLPAIDALVEDAVELGATGARLTGGGFGGCIVACVERKRRDAWQETLLAKHPKARFVDAITPK
ncbi:galactokinase [Pontixanthobacter aestiaquae]|uniref:Galactokinase n=1 Tax=Pontixanthobacter aestiaquae TaxID=1509367 RepID=A0A844ZBJ2_9SPHN|nr:galactokinase [Pontixanthobacter aestiaquae]MDN3644723.1 galactokinase [Pontixanthobacter aestiaquae]MXO84270.1 galactokinase [Pontixanthobacter aestiaquae]